MGMEWEEIEREHVIKEIATDSKSPLGLSVKLFQLNSYYVKREFEDAKTYMNGNEFDNLSVDVLKNVVAAERLFIELITGGDPENIEKLYTKQLANYLKVMKTQISTYRILMAYEGLYKKNREKAMEYMEKAKEIEKTYPYKGDAKLELGLINLVLEKME